MSNWEAAHKDYTRKKSLAPKAVKILNQPKTEREATKVPDVRVAFMEGFLTEITKEAGRGMWGRSLKKRKAKAPSSKPATGEGTPGGRMSRKKGFSGKHKIFYRMTSEGPKRV